MTSAFVTPYLTVFQLHHGESVVILFVYRCTRTLILELNTDIYFKEPTWYQSVHSLLDGRNSAKTMVKTELTQRRRYDTLTSTCTFTHTFITLTYIVTSPPPTPPPQLHKYNVHKMGLTKQENTCLLGVEHDVEFTMMCVIMKGLYVFIAD